MKLNDHLIKLNDHLFSQKFFSVIRKLPKCSFHENQGTFLSLQAALHGSVTVLHWLLEKGLDPNHFDGRYCISSYFFNMMPDQTL